MHTPSRPFERLRQYLGAILLCAIVAGCGGNSGNTPADPQEPVLVNAIGPGQFKEAVALKTFLVADISAVNQAPAGVAFPVQPRYGVQTYRLTYLTLDGLGHETLASALVAVPQKPANAVSPVVSYQHGTLTRDSEAPSNRADAGGPEVALASQGYIVLAPDYVGYGVTKGAAHPYLLSAPSASVVIDLLTAAKYWRQTRQLRDNQQLFLVGYSEGGFVTMAAHRALQLIGNVHLADLVLSAPGAGPYNVGLTLDESLKQVREANPLLGALINPGFLKLLSAADRNNVRDQLVQQLLGSDTDVVFMTNALDNYLADDRTAIEQVSDVYDWRPVATVKLFHGRDDKTVSYRNASSTLQTMQTRGAGSWVTVTDCSAQPAGHLECVLPYWNFVLQTLSTVAKNL